MISFYIIGLKGMTAGTNIPII